MHLRSKLSLAVGMVLLQALPARSIEVPDFTVEQRSEKKQRTLRFLPPSAHHFNPKAPNAVFDVANDKKKINGLKVLEKHAEISLPSDITKVEAELYLCDDANTFCIKKRQAFDFGISADPVSKAAPGHKQHEKNVSPSTPDLPAHGFIVNDAEKAFHLAKQSKKPLLIDFFGIWCPPCNQLDSTVFSSREFKRAGNSFVLLKLDADAPLSWELKSRYKVTAYPTIVFTTPEGEEIDRILGSRSSERFLAIMNEALKHADRPLSTLEAGAKSGDFAAALRLGYIQIEREAYAAAQSAFERAKELAQAGKGEFTPHAERNLMGARIWALRDERKKAKEGKKDIKAMTDRLAAMAREGIMAFPGTAESLWWSSLLADLSEDTEGEAKARMKTEGYTLVIDNAQLLLKSPKRLKQTEMPLTDVLQNLAWAQKELGRSDAAKKTYARAASEYARAIAEARKTSGEADDRERGYNLERAYCLSESGQSAQAERLYRKLQKSYPEEFTFFFAHASMLRREKRLPESEKIARMAIERSYGDNRLRSVELWAKVLLELKRGAEAMTLVDQTLKETRLPDDPGVRTHRYYKNLVALRETLAK